MGFVNRARCWTSSPCRGPGMPSTFHTLCQTMPSLSLCAISRQRVGKPSFAIAAIHPKSGNGSWRPLVGVPVPPHPPLLRLPRLPIQARRLIVIALAVVAAVVAAAAVVIQKMMTPPLQVLVPKIVGEILRMRIAAFVPNLNQKIQIHSTHLKTALPHPLQLQDGLAKAEEAGNKDYNSRV